MIETKQSLEVQKAVAALKATLTHDGTYIVVDPDGLSASGVTEEHAKREIRRLKAAGSGRVS